MKIFRYLALAAVAATLSMTTPACSSASDKALDVAVEQINKEIEGQTMPGIVEMNMSKDDKYVVYNYVVDEDITDINMMKESAAEQKTMLKSQIVANKDQQDFIKLVKLSDHGLKFAYKGNKSGDSYEIVFENDEL